MSAMYLLQVSGCDKNSDDSSSVPLPPGWQRHEGAMLSYHMVFTTATACFF